MNKTEKEPKPLDANQQLTRRKEIPNQFNDPRNYCGLGDKGRFSLPENPKESLPVDDQPPQSQN